MSFPFNASTIAKITGSHEDAVAKTWPLIWQELQRRGIVSIQPVVALIATVGVECKFAPIEEQGNAAYFQRMYGKRDDYEVDEHGLWKWRGRGFIQLTGKANYEKYGAKIGQNLICDPGFALVPSFAAQVLIEYMLDHGCFTWASRGHWLNVRKLVNGGTNGLAPFLDSVWALLAAAYT